MSKTLKQIIARIVMFLIACSVLATVAAATEMDDVTTVPSEIIAIREDVSIAEAMTDVNFSLSNATSNAANLQPRLTYEWATWGETEYEEYTHYPIPIGYSAQISSAGQIMHVYHYTRTYIDMRALLWDDFRADSGRVWGYDIVKATGTVCDPEVYDLGTHVVKYGYAN